MPALPGARLRDKSVLVERVCLEDKSSAWPFAAPWCRIHPFCCLAQSIKADQEMLRNTNSVSVGMREVVSATHSNMILRMVPRLLDEVSWIKPIYSDVCSLTDHMQCVQCHWIRFYSFTDVRTRQRAHWTPRASVLYRGPWRRFQISFTADMFWSNAQPGCKARSNLH